MPRKTFTHKTTNGDTAKRTSTTKAYTHVVVDADSGDVLRWSESAAAATKAIGSRDLGGKSRAMRAEAINGGERDPTKMAGKTAKARKVAARKPAAKKPATPAKKATAPVGFIDAALMERAIKLRGEGKSMKEIGVLLNVKATAYLAKKIKATYGADALDRPRKEA
jgi:hypothetical protein